VSTILISFLGRFLLVGNERKGRERGQDLEEIKARKLVGVVVTVTVVVAVA
jgi:hypothetical protein